MTQACEYWVAPAPAGNDANPGSFAQPWATFVHAATHIPDNYCTVWIKDGTYTEAVDIEERYTTPATFKAVHLYKAILQYSGTALELSGARNIIIEGLEIRQTGPGSGGLLIQVRRSLPNDWAEQITLRNNIIHDSYNNDLLKIFDGARFITVENNVFYNQGPDEEHMDVNSVTDVVIQDNIFFNDYAGSGRSDPGDTKAFITVKDSNVDADGLLGSERVDIRRNIFLNWQGDIEPFLQIGNSGNLAHEVKVMRIENNLMIGNAQDMVNSLLALSGVKDITFANNTVVGDLPSDAYAFRVDQKGVNLQNQNLYFYNNIWSDPSGTMGADLSGDKNNFSGGEPVQVSNLILDNNLYWNGPNEIPPGKVASPLLDDARRVVTDPLLNTNHAAIVLPRWNGSAFLSGSLTIQQEFERLVELYGKLPANSPAIGKADPAFAPPDDILGRPRSASPEMGAYELDALASVPRVFLPLVTNNTP